MTPIRVISEHYETDAWADPWGKPQAAYVVDDYIGLTPIDRRLHHYHNGYTEATGQVYVAPDGDTCFAVAPTDYHGSTVFRWLTGNRANNKTRSYSRPTQYQKYVFDGAPVRWDRDTNDFILCESLDTTSQER